ncbi:hypothetical protein [Paenibacillus flagellatus]|uniref:Uncharacterized protein n=1 Tax=Paenibacillus flagellatus TaxID=2211139 RepID=A0A2V5KAR3_9BACL|nr:hypothetical protein [Paenibacillus flagellatus]PYI55204.1 hypothetical protein DLM86_11820 [Paenibacillus flagellatus]
MEIGVVALLLALIAFAAIATVWIGNSKQNKEGNPEYDQRTGKNTIRLTVFYVVAAVVACVALIWYVTG